MPTFGSWFFGNWHQGKIIDQLAHEEKDLNDMYIAGHDVQSLVEFNTYSGLEAHIKLTEWKKV